MAIFTIFLQFYRFVFLDQYCRDSGFTWETIIKIMSFAIDFDLYSKKKVKKSKKISFSRFSPFSGHFFEITIKNEIVDLKILHRLYDLRIRKFSIVFEI